MTEDDAKSIIAADVSRETLEKLESYVAALLKWQKAINLIAPSTIPHVWERHILDSAQVFKLRHVESGSWLDIGSGAGFPGLVCAIMASELAPDLSFTFIESDLRKGSFIREVARICSVKVAVLTRRVEDAPAQNAHIISARALADLQRLCDLAFPHLAPDGKCLFLKGANAEQEIIEAKEIWQMSLETHPSLTSTDGRIVEIGDLSRV